MIFLVFWTCSGSPFTLVLLLNCKIESILPIVIYESSRKAIAFLTFLNDIVFRVDFGFLKLQIILTFLQFMPKQLEFFFSVLLQSQMKTEKNYSEDCETWQF